MSSLEKYFGLENRNIVVTGAAGLLGEKHAEAILEAGGTPILVDINIQKLSQVAKPLGERFGVKVPYFELDITEESSVKDFSQKLYEGFKVLHGLVNNAAIDPKVSAQGDVTNPSRIENFSLDSWNLEIAVGLTGAFLCTKYLGPFISENPNGGSIVNISSDLGIVAPDQRLYEKPGTAPEEQNVKPLTYSVIKTGLIGMTKYTSTYWATKNVRCNALCPGGVFNNQPEEFLSKVTSRIPMARMADKDEYQGSLIFLLSDASRYMTGTTLVVDGGRTCW